MLVRRFKMPRQIACFKTNRSCRNESAKPYRRDRVRYIVRKRRTHTEVYDRHPVK